MVNESLYLNKICYQEEKEPTNTTILWISLIISFFFLVSCIFEIQRSIPIYAVYDIEKNALIINYELEKMNDLLTIKEIQIENQKFPFQIKNISEIFRNDSINKNVQNIEINSPYSFLNNQIIQIKLLDKKDKVIKKIFQDLLK